MARPQFSVLRVDGRIDNALAHLRNRCDAEALLVTAHDNIRYLTGFTGSSAVLLVRSDDSVMVTDGRYVEQAALQIRESGAQVRIVEARTTAETIDAIAREMHGLAACAFESGDVSVEMHAHYQRTFPCHLIPVSGVVQELRRTKSQPEIERITFAAQTADAALGEVVQLLELSMSEVVTERDIRDELEYRMRKHGADGPSYETIVATGANSARPHHRPTHEQLREGHSVVIDVGGLVDGYHSDMTRTFLLGQVDAKLSEMFAIVCEAQQAGAQAVRAGVAPSEIDHICRSVITKAGFGEEFVHGTGHGVGLAIHEAPWLRAHSNEALRVGEVVTVEPGVYRVGLGGVRIEDLILVHETGNTNLSQSSKDNLCLQSPRMI